MIQSSINQLLGSLAVGSTIKAVKSGINKNNEYIDSLGKDGKEFMEKLEHAESPEGQAAAKGVEARRAKIKAAGYKDATPDVVADFFGEGTYGYEKKVGDTTYKADPRTGVYSSTTIRKRAMQNFMDNAMAQHQQSGNFSELLNELNQSEYNERGGR